MIRIVICDDEQRIINTIKSKIEQSILHSEHNDLEYNYFETTSSRVLLEYARAFPIDILFLDIHMPSIDGIEIAEKFFEGYPNALIIFVSSQEEMVFYTMRFRPFRFIRKANLNNEIEEAVVSAIKRVILFSRNLVINESGELTFVNIFNIMYIGSEKNYINIFTVETSYRCREKLKNVFEQLKFSELFLKANSGTLINMKYILQIKKKEIVLKNKLILPLSGNNYDFFVETFMRYMRNTECIK